MSYHTGYGYIPVIGGGSRKGHLGSPSSVTESICECTSVQIRGDCPWKSNSSMMRLHVYVRKRRRTPESGKLEVMLGSWYQYVMKLSFASNAFTIVACLEMLGMAGQDEQREITLKTEPLIHSIRCIAPAHTHTLSGPKTCSLYNESTIFSL